MHDHPGTQAVQSSLPLETPRAERMIGGRVLLVLADLNDADAIGRDLIRRAAARLGSEGLLLASDGSTALGPTDVLLLRTRDGLAAFSRLEPGRCRRSELAALSRRLNATASGFGHLRAAELLHVRFAHMREAPRSTPVSYLEWALSQAQAAFADENPHLAESIARAILEGIPASASHLPRAIFARIRADALAIAAVEARSANEPWPVSQARRSYQIAQRAFQRAAYAWQSTVCFAKARALLTRTDDEQGSQLWLPGMRPAEAEVPAVRIGYRARRCIGFRLAIGAADTPGRAEKTRERAFFTHLGSLDCDDRRLAGWLSGARSMQTKPAVALHDVSGDGSRAILEATLDDEHLVLLGAAGAGAPFKADAEHVVVSVRSDSHHATPSVISTRIGRTAEFQLIANHDGPLRGEVLFRMPGGVAVRACIGDVQARAMRH